MADYQNRLLAFIKRAEQATQAAKERALRAHDLTTAQYNSMLVLSHAPAITASELARRCFVTVQTTSSVLARLVERGLVTRTAHARHRGVVEVSLTPAGQRLLELADRRVLQVEASLAAALEPAEQDELRRLLACCTNAADQSDTVSDAGR
jgi:DNA-binding MarR family transcriptional regulator